MVIMIHSCYITHNINKSCLFLRPAEGSGILKREGPPSALLTLDLLFISFPLLSPFFFFSPPSLLLFFSIPSFVVFFAVHCLYLGSAFDASK